MARVLLLLPPSPRGENVSRGLMGGFGMRVGRQLRYPPIRTALTAAVLEESGHEVSILDANAEGWSLDRCVGRISSRSNAESLTGSLDFVAFPCSKDGFETEMELCRRLKRSSDDLKLCVFGPMAQHRMDECLDAGADFVLSGEVEAVLPNCLDALQGEQDANLVGVYRRPTEAGAGDATAGKTIVGQGSGRVEDLDALPLPAFHLLNFQLYGYPDDPRAMTVVHASRGCPIGCSFCAYMVNEGRTVRSRSVEHVMAELDAARKHGVELVVFRDPIFTLQRKRILDLCHALEERGSGLEWICETALSCLDPELLQHMARAGRISLSFGVESGNDALQRKYAKNKIRSKAHAVAMVRECERLGIRTRGFFMMGFPEEDEAMRDETVQFALDLDPDTVQFVPLTLYAGTPLFIELAGKELAGEKLVIGEESAVAGYETGPEVETAIRRAYRRFYARPGRVLRELRTPQALIRKAGRYFKLRSTASSASSVA